MNDWTKDREIIDAATSGPWELRDDDPECGGAWISYMGPPVIDVHGASTPGGVVYSDFDAGGLATGITISDDDARFISSARTRWPAALDEIERLTRERDEARVELELSTAALSCCADLFVSFRAELLERCEAMDACLKRHGLRAVSGALCNDGEG
jgi:hypothetical protein